MNKLNSQRAKSGGPRGIGTFNKNFSVDCVRDHHELVVSRDEQFGVVIASKLEKESCVIDFIEVPVQLKGFLRF